ncbi:MAG: diaminopimelate epimerase [Eggerthellaceae bacterium]|nr:diaminopimelate epimerase [Eggerthellaceae bacterium]
MILDFAKIHGCGNDFILIDDFSEEVELAPRDVAALCDRRLGVGADGIILIRPAKAQGSTAFMHYINSDGSLAEMCGNGIRCFAKYLVDRGFVPARSGGFTADTRAGQKQISFEIDGDERLVRAQVDMGCPELAPEKVPTTIPANAQTAAGGEYVREAAIASPWGEFAFTCVSMGNPHAVCFIDDWTALPGELFAEGAERGLDSFDVARVGAFFEGHSVFPEKANIEFADVRADGIHVRTYERGCAETLACGTGACATGVAASLTGRAGRENEVVLRGGVLEIFWDGHDHVIMTGPAKEVFSGTVEIR